MLLTFLHLILTLFYLSFVIFVYLHFTSFKIVFFPHLYISLETSAEWNLKILLSAHRFNKQKQKTVHFMVTSYIKKKRKIISCKWIFKKYNPSAIRMCHNKPSALLRLICALNLKRDDFSSLLFCMGSLPQWNIFQSDVVHQKSSH